MAYEIRENTGSIFKNFKKEKDTQPDYKGEALINGVPMWISAWKKADKNNNAWFSFSFAEKKDKPVDSHNQAKQNAYQPETVSDDDIPF
jgi:hypothetical protein